MFPKELSLLPPWQSISAAGLPSGPVPQQGLPVNASYKSHSFLSHLLGHEELFPLERHQGTAFNVIAEGGEDLKLCRSDLCTPHRWPEVLFYTLYHPETRLPSRSTCWARVDLLLVMCWVTGNKRGSLFTKMEEPGLSGLPLSLLCWKSKT